MTELTFRLNNPQLEAYRAVAPGNVVFTGYGRGLGKSWWHRFVWWSYIAQYDGKTRIIEHEGMVYERRGVRIGVLMPTLKQFKDVHAKEIQTELDGPWAFLRGRYDKAQGTVEFPGGSTVIPMPAEEHNSKKGRGLRADIISLDEADDIDCEVYDGTAVPWTSAPWSLKIHLLGGTPTRGRHGLWYRTLDLGRKGQRLRDGATPEEVGVDPEVAESLKRIYSFHATYEDAPETVDVSSVRLAKATMPEATFRREYMADPDAGEGLVFPEFDEDFHVRADHPELTDFREFHVGIDHGDVDPGVMILFGVLGHGNDRRVWALDEWYEPGCLNSTWDERAHAWKEMVPGIITQYWPDPSRADRIRDWRGQGLRVNPIQPSMKPIHAGIARIAELLHRREDERFGDWCRLYMHPRCNNLIREMGIYRHKKHPDGSFSETPEDKDNHTVDALRYFASAFGPTSGSKSVVNRR